MLFVLFISHLFWITATYGIPDLSSSSILVVIIILTSFTALIASAFGVIRHIQIMLSKLYTKNQHWIGEDKFEFSNEPAFQWVLDKPTSEFLLGINNLFLGIFIINYGSELAEFTFTGVLQDEHSTSGTEIIIGFIFIIIGAILIRRAFSHGDKLNEVIFCLLWYYRIRKLPNIYSETNNINSWVKDLRGFIENRNWEEFKDEMKFRFFEEAFAEAKTYAEDLDLISNILMKYLNSEEPKIPGRHYPFLNLIPIWSYQKQNLSSSLRSGHELCARVINTPKFKNLDILSIIFSRKTSQANREMIRFLKYLQALDFLFTQITRLFLVTLSELKYIKIKPVTIKSIHGDGPLDFEFPKELKLNSLKSKESYLYTILFTSWIIENSFESKDSISIPLIYENKHNLQEIIEFKPSKKSIQIIEKYVKVPLSQLINELDAGLEEGKLIKETYSELSQTVQEGKNADWDWLDELGLPLDQLSTLFMSGSYKNFLELYNEFKKIYSTTFYVTFSLFVNDYLSAFLFHPFKQSSIRFSSQIDNNILGIEKRMPKITQFKLDKI